MLAHAQPRQQNLFDLHLSPAKLLRGSKSSRSTTPPTQTAIQNSFEAAKTIRASRYLLILGALASFGSDPENCPTARELLPFLFEQGQAPNPHEAGYTAPRLTELRGLEMVENPDYIKTVAGERPAAVWRITERGREFLRQVATVSNE